MIRTMFDCSRWRLGTVANRPAKLSTGRGTSIDRFSAAQKSRPEVAICRLGRAKTGGAVPSTSLRRPPRCFKRGLATGDPHELRDLKIARAAALAAASSPPVLWIVRSLIGCDREPVEVVLGLRRS
ncbi:hypothetical protein [Bradyrhizobium sp. S3.2.12]|uniref:hypothetical protein n=1 Tax=Bradyrhizobium sp. S3.2.12 TaxID=3156387 RepID=UPI00339710A9